MFNRIVKGAVVAGALSIAPMMAARAGIVESATNACTTGSLIVCVSFSLNQVDADSYTLTATLNSVNANNNSGAYFTALGLFGGTLSGSFSNLSTTASGWTVGTPGGDCTDLTSSQSGIFICDSVNGSGGKLTTVTFSFDYTGSASDFNTINSSDLAAHIQGIPAGATTCSVKTGTDAQTNTTTFLTAPAAGCGGTTTTPEPASLVLVGTGLVGIGGLIRRRRRTA